MGGVDMSASGQMLDQGFAPQPGGVLLGNVAYIPPGLESQFKDVFTYNVVFNPIANGQTLTGSTNINNDSFFVCVQHTATIWDSATQNTTNTQPNVAPMLVEILDSSSGKAKMDQPVPIGSLFGTALAPFTWLYRASLFLPGGQLTVRLTNQMAASQTVRLSFHGFKVYKMPDTQVRFA